MSATPIILSFRGSKTVESGQFVRLWRVFQYVFAATKCRIRPRSQGRLTLASNCMPIKVIILADTALSSQLLSEALNEYRNHFTVVAHECALKLFLKQLQKHGADVAVISWTLEGDPQGGLKALRELRAAAPNVRPVVMLDTRDSESVVKAFSAGARGVLGSADPLEMLCKCIKSVQVGQVWANSQEAQWILKALQNKEPHRVLASHNLPSLTSRQAQIVTMVAEGLPNKDIASALGVSEHTVRNHLFRIYERLGVTNRVELIFYALSHGNSRAPSSAE